MEHISTSLNNAWLLLLKESKANPGLPFLIFQACSIPLGFAVSNIALAFFIAASILSFRKQPLKFEPYFLWPVLFFVLIVISLVWTEDTSKTVRGITKMLPFLFLPLPFLLGYTLTKLQKELMLRCFAFSMFGFAIYYLLKALIRFILTGDTMVFFYHELVTVELNAIYVSVFFILSFFIFLLQKRNLIHLIALFTLSALLLLLSSKNAVVVFVILLFVYVFRNKNNIIWNFKTKLVLIVASVLMVFTSIHFTKRYTDEIGVQWSKFNNPEQVSVNPNGTHNVSLFEAWNNDKFTENDYFTGVSLRVYLIRVFKEIVQQRNNWYLGTGYYATERYLKKSVEEKGLYPDYSRFNFHNQYIQIFAELGVVGLLMVLALLYKILHTSIKTKDFITFVFSILMISLFLTESFFHRQRGVLFFVLFYCVLSASKELRPQK